jgi:hypothetical protein
MQWLVARFQPTSLFSLKHSDATSTGGKSLLVPTPFAIRMALLDVAIRTEGVQVGPQAFKLIKSLKLAIEPPAHAAVSSIFVRVLKPERNAEARGREMASTIAFREYVHLNGELTLAFGANDQTLTVITPWLMQVNYFGKRGSLFQLLASPQRINTEHDEPPDGLLSFPGRDMLSGAQPAEFLLGLIQRIDEWGEPLMFEQANIYNRGPRSNISVGKERRRLDVILPYRMVYSSRGFSLYERFEL